MDGSGNCDPEGQEGSRRKKVGAKALAAIGIVVAGFLTTVGVWLANRGTDAVEGAGSPDLVSFSAAQVKHLCGGGPLFIPAGEAREVLAKPPPEDSELFDLPGVRSVEGGTVEVSIQGESQRTITLTGIEFTVEPRPRPSGGVAIHGQCGDAGVGYTIQVDLDSNPPRITDAMFAMPGKKTRPITFPWRVSLSDPLLLYVSPHSDRCDCEWSARIPWVSGSKRGVITIDDGGRGFPVVSGEGLPSYLLAGDRWSRSYY